MAEYFDTLTMDVQELTAMEDVLVELAYQVNVGANSTTMQNALSGLVMSGGTLTTIISILCPAAGSVATFCGILCSAISSLGGKSALRNALLQGANSMVLVKKDINASSFLKRADLYKIEFSILSTVYNSKKLVFPQGGGEILQCRINFHWFDV